MVLKRIQKTMQWFGWAVFILLAVNGLFSAMGGKSFLDISVGLAQPDEQAIVDNSQASVPLYLDYEGYLIDMDGAPLTGYYTVTLRIYTGVANPVGSELWAEVHPNVPVRDGRFSVLLGNNTALPESIFDLPDRFIGATVAPFDELVPRQRLASVPYAVHADHAASLNAPDGSPVDAVFVDDEGKIGIGTTAPSQKFEVVGDTFLDGHLGIGVSNPQLALEVNGATDLSGTVNIASWASQSLTENGYAKTGSLLLQWGKYSDTIPQGTYIISFPIGFTEAYNVQCTIINDPWTTNQETFCQAVTLNPTQAVIAINWTGAGPNEAEGFYWFAIGK